MCWKLPISQVKITGIMCFQLRSLGNVDLGYVSWKLIAFVINDQSFISNPFYATTVSVSKLLQINNRWIELISTPLDFAFNLIDSLIDFLSFLRYFCALIMRWIPILRRVVVYVVFLASSMKKKYICLLQFFWTKYFMEIFLRCQSDAFFSF